MKITKLTVKAVDPRILAPFYQNYIDTAVKDEMKKPHSLLETEIWLFDFSERALRGGRLYEHEAQAILDKYGLMPVALYELACFGYLHDEVVVALGEKGISVQATAKKYFSFAGRIYCRAALKCADYKNCFLTNEDGMYAFLGIKPEALYCEPEAAKK